MNKGFTVYVSPLEMDSTAHRLVELPMEQEKLDALQLELNTGSPLYTEVSDFCGREYLEEHLPEDMDLTELNLSRKRPSRALSAWILIKERWNYRCVA